MSEANRKGGEGMKNAMQISFSVSYLLSFGDKVLANGSRELVMGWGNAGWTQVNFGANRAAAFAFARAMPAQSRMRGFDRMMESFGAKRDGNSWRLPGFERVGS